MSNTGFKGVDVRQTGSELVFRAFLQTSSGALVTTGTTNFYLMELQSDGTIATYDFSSNTVKTGAVTTETLAGTYRKSNNATTDTGLWTATLSTLTGLTVGAVYIVRVNNAAASPTDQMREFQYGGDQGDLVVTAGTTGVAYLQDDLREILGTASAGAAGYVQMDLAQAIPSSPAANTTGEALYMADLFRGRVGTAQGGSTAYITLDAGASSDSTSYIGDAIWLCGGTGGGLPGTGQFRTIVGYNGSTKQAVPHKAFGTAPDSTTKFMTLPQSKADVWLALAGLSTASGGVLDVNAKNLGGTAQTGADVGAATAASAIAAAVWNAITASYTTTGTFGKLVGAIVNQTGDAYNYLTTNLGALGANLTSTVSNVWTSATRVLTAGTNIALAKGTGVTGFNDITAAAAATAVWTDLTSSSDFSTAGSIGALVKADINAPIGSIPTNPYTGTPPTAAAIAAQVWTDLTAGSDFSTAGSIGALLKTDINAAIGSIAVPPSAAAIATAVLTDTSDNTTAGSLGYLVAQNLDAKVSSRAPSFSTVTLDASQPNYAPAKVSDVGSAETAITSAISALQSHGDANWESAGGSATLANQEAILAKLTGTVKILSPLALDQSLTLIAGDDYYAADGRAPSWSIPNYTGPSLTGATVAFLAISKSDFDAGNVVSPAISLAGSASVVSGTALFTVEIPGSDTSGLAASPPDDRFDYVYQLKAVAGSHTITEAIGALTICRRVG